MGTLGEVVIGLHVSVLWLATESLFSLELRRLIRGQEVTWWGGVNYGEVTGFPQHHWVEFYLLGAHQKHHSCEIGWIHSEILQLKVEICHGQL